MNKNSIQIYVFGDCEQISPNAVICGVELRQVPPLVFGSHTETFQLDLEEKSRIVKEMARETFAESMCVQEDSYSVSARQRASKPTKNHVAIGQRTSNEETPIAEPNNELVSQYRIFNERKKK